MTFKNKWSLGIALWLSSGCIITPRYTPEEIEQINTIKVYRYYKMLPQNVTCEFIKPIRVKDGWISESSLEKGEFFGSEGRYEPLIFSIRSEAYRKKANVIVIDRLKRPNPYARDERRYVFRMDASLYKCK